MSVHDSRTRKDLLIPGGRPWASPLPRGEGLGVRVSHPHPSLSQRERVLETLRLTLQHTAAVDPESRAVF